MSKSLYVKITQGLSIGPYSIYYDAVQPNNYAFLYGTTTNASNIPLSALTSGDGVRITIPSTATSVIIQNANGDCLNYKTYSIAQFESVTAACTGFYNGTATINVTISGDDDLYQYSKDGGLTLSASTTEKTYAFTNVSNGSYNIAVKNVSDGVVILYGSNPVVLNCAPVLVTSFLGECFLNPPPEETYFAYIFISASGGSGNYKYAIQKTGGVKTPPQISNAFNNLDPIAQYTMFVYDVDNTVNPNYEVTVGTTTFDCPAPVPPVTLSTTVGCAPTGYVGTGTVLADNFAGGTGVYMYMAFGTTEAEVRAILADVSPTSARIILEGALSYFWKALANGSYFVAIQDSQSRITVVETAPVSCTNIEPPIKQFLTYSLITNSCTKFGAPTRYWTYDTALVDGYYKLNGSDIVLKLETATNISQRGFQINTIVSAPCVLTDVTLTPGITFSANQYLLLVNNVAYSEITSGTNAFPAGSVVRLSFNAGSEVCGVVLNGQAYAANTNVTLVAGTTYNFVINATNSFVPQGAVYCEANQSKRLFVNACGTQETRIITPCSTACTSTTFTETCSGTYGQNVLRTFYYVCNGLATGTTTTVTCGSCSSTAQDWQTESTYCKPGDCTKWNLQRQLNPCAAGYNTTREVDTNTANCDCGEGCLGTYEAEPFCDPSNPTTAIYVTRNVCFPNSVISSRTVPCSSFCNASTAPNWVNEGAVFCSSCVQKQTQRQTNACAAEYNTTRVVNATDGSTTCACGEGCKGTETYNFCGGTDNKDLYTVQRYVCPPNNYIGTPSLVQTCSSPTCTTLTPTFTSQGYSACYTPPTGSNNCSTGPVYRDTNRCSSTYNNYFIDINSTYYNVGGQPTAGACNTTQIWTDTGNTRCNICVNEKEQRQTNRCASGYETTRWVAGGSACNYAANYSNAVGYVYSCSGGVVSSTIVYQNTNSCFTGNQWKVGNTTYASNPSQSYPNTNPTWANSGDPYCIFGSCTLRQNQVNTNPCSTATTQTIDTGVVSNSCGTWNWVYYCVNFGVAPYERRRYEQNSCTLETRNDQLVSYDSLDCGYVPPRDSFYVGTPEGDAEFACTRIPSAQVYCYSGCSGGNPVYGSRIVYSATGNDPIANGFYSVFGGTWMEISGSNGVVSDTGTC